MEIEKTAEVAVETIELRSVSLDRLVKIDFYKPVHFLPEAPLSLLLINDGQDLLAMEFENLLNFFFQKQLISPILCVGIHSGEDRMDEYGIAASPDYLGRGAKAGLYEQFVLTELLPFIARKFHMYAFAEKAFAGFSLGGLSALDIVWRNPDVFSKVSVFSGSLWWRSKDKDDKDYNQHTDRLMHAEIRKGSFHPGLKFFFQCGELDEAEDRNRNGIIDSIDDAIDLMRELLKKGYREGRHFYYLQMPDGKHDLASWTKAMPTFLKWAWGQKNSRL